MSHNTRLHYTLESFEKPARILVINANTAGKRQLLTKKNCKSLDN